jgi:hypothetical protein
MATATRMPRRQCVNNLSKGIWGRHLPIGYVWKRQLTVFHLHYYPRKDL